MKKIAAWVMAMGLVGGLVAGCGTPTRQNVVAKLQSEAQVLNTQNYKSTAMMTVQMDNSSQTYYIETWYEAPDTYRIALGDGNKNINQIIVHNPNGMFIVSPSLQKVFRFNGNWAQNQGHIYLYDQIIQQIVSGQDVKVSKDGRLYAIDIPISPANDVVSRQRVLIDSSTLDPKQVVLYDKDNKAVVTIEYKSFQTNVKFVEADFDPHKLVKQAVTTISYQQPTEFAYVDPGVTLNDALSVIHPEEQDDVLLRYMGQNPFTLEEWRPNPGVDGMANVQLVDLFGVPAMYLGSGSAHQLVWLNNGIQFALTSSHLSVDQMKTVAISTFAQVGK